MSIEKKTGLFKRPVEGDKTKIDRLDFGYKKLDGNKLYLSQEGEDIVYGAVKFDVDDNIITGPDGTKFDLNNMNYGGPDGIYAYLRKVSGTVGVKTDANSKDKLPN